MSFFNAKAGKWIKYANFGFRSVEAFRYELKAKKINRNISSRYGDISKKKNIKFNPLAHENISSHGNSMKFLSHVKGLK